MHQALSGAFAFAKSTLSSTLELRDKPLSALKSANPLVGEAMVSLEDNHL